MIPCSGKTGAGLEVSGDYFEFNMSDVYFECNMCGDDHDIVASNDIGKGLRGWNDGISSPSSRV